MAPFVCAIPSAKTYPLPLPMVVQKLCAIMIPFLNPGTAATLTEQGNPCTCLQKEQHCLPAFLPAVCHQVYILFLWCTPIQSYSHDTVSFMATRLLYLLDHSTMSGFIGYSVSVNRITFQGILSVVELSSPWTFILYCASLLQRQKTLIKLVYFSCVPKLQKIPVI